MFITTSLWSVVLFLLSFSFALFIWKRRKLYILSAKLDGPFSFPLIGSAHKFYGSHKDIFKKVHNEIKKYPAICKVWLGPELYVVDSRPEDIEILSNCIQKPKLYDVLAFELGNGLLTAHADIWKKHRKIINPTFNSQVLNSFYDSFIKNSLHFVEQSSENCGKGIVDLFPMLLKMTVNLSCENLLDVNSADVRGQDDYIWTMIRLEEMSVERACSLFERFDLIFSMSKTKQIALSMLRNSTNFIHQILDLKKSSSNLIGNDKVKMKRFLNHLLTVGENKYTNKQDIIDEVHTMIVTSSETAAATLSFSLMILGLYSDIQEKIFGELDTILSDDQSNITLEHVNKMEYLERFINETMRVMSPLPIIGRHIEKEITLSDGLKLPTGTNLLVPIVHMNNNPEVWNNPQKFDPDHFLPEEVKKRHRCAFIPFGFGQRNCIGFKYAMMNMKITLAVFLNTYKIVDVKYKNKEEIPISYAILLKPSNGCLVAFEKRIKSKS